MKALKPTGIIGVSTIAKAFDKEVLQTMAALNERPIVFALSNPTSKSECTFEEAVKETKGKVSWGFSVSVLSIVGYSFSEG